MRNFSIGVCTAVLCVVSVVGRASAQSFNVGDVYLVSSSLPGAVNVQLPTGGHFRLLGRPETLALVLAPPPPLPPVVSS